LRCRRRYAPTARGAERHAAYVAYAARTAAPLSPTPHGNRTSDLPSLVTGAPRRL